MIDSDFTKTIVNNLLKDLVAKEDVQKIETRLNEIERNMATKDELVELEKRVVTKRRLGKGRGRTEGI